LGIVCILFFFVYRTKENAYLKTLILLTDPVLIVSGQGGVRTVTVVSVPRSLLFDGVRGYGRYPLSSLLTLGAIDGIGGTLVKETLSESFAVPVEGYIGRLSAAEMEPNTIKNQAQGIRDIFCGMKCVMRFVQGQTYATDFSLAAYLRFSFLFHGLSESDVSSIDVLKKNSVTEVTDTDGVTGQIFDVKKYDTYIPKAFEEISIRKEALRIRVINATTYAGLAEQFSRRLFRAGAFPVAVESGRDNDLKQCEIKGTKKILHSETARYIKNVYGCSESEENTQEALYDLTVRVGATYEKMHLPLRQVPRQILRPL
jgi:hypothetical protein